MIRVMKEVKKFEILEINSLKDDFKSTAYGKLAEISQLQVYLLNTTENLQKAEAR